MRGDEGGVYGVSANEYSCAHEAQIDIGDLITYLTYDKNCLQSNSRRVVGGGGSGSLSLFCGGDKRTNYRRRAQAVRPLDVYGRIELPHHKIKNK
jgi:hypothetical protein